VLLERHSRHSDRAPKAEEKFRSYASSVIPTL
jgi:hypothetical protein